jgi:hypothetical protein
MSIKLLTALGLSAVLLGGCGGGSASATPTPEGFMDIPQPVPTEMATPPEMNLTLQGGEGNYKTERFNLFGNYAVDWSLDCTKTTTTIAWGGSLMLQQVDEPLFLEFLFNKVSTPSDGEGSKVQRGQTNLYGLTDADYYLQTAIFECDWEVVFTPSP